MCNDLIRVLQENSDLYCGGAVNPRHWQNALEYADKEWRLALPEEYGKLLKKVNGIRSDVLQVYGIMPVDGFEDLIDRNEGFCGDLVLGAGLDDLLIYRQDGSYAVVDRENGAVCDVFATLENALFCWLDL